MPLTVETEILRWRNEKRAQQIAGGESIQLGGHVDETTDHRWSAPEAEYPVQVERSDLRIVSLVVGEVKVVR